jgi:hypothetical protein
MVFDHMNPPASRGNFFNVDWLIWLLLAQCMLEGLAGNVIGGFEYGSSTAYKSNF